MSDIKKKRPGEDVPSGPGIQGEGDYVSGRAYQKDAKQFTESHDTEKLARDAAPKDEAERRALAEAEQKGKARAKGRKPPKP